MPAFVQRNRTVLGLCLAALVVAYLFYFTKGPATLAVFGGMWSYAVPLVLAALVGVIGERSGVVNIGIEGQMLLGAFAAFFVAANTRSMILGVLAGVAVGLLLGAFLALTTVVWGMDQIIAGVVLNIVATGLTSFYYKQGNTLPSVMPNVQVPILSKIPLIGPTFFSSGPIALCSLFAAFLVYYLLFKTRWGLRTRAIGEHPHAADTAGINVIRMRLINVTLAGGLAGLAGAYLSMEASSSFELGMTAGRGFLALAIMIFGAWHPLKALAAALFFGLMSSIASQLQLDNVVNIPEQFVNLLPYLLTLIVLAAFAGRVRPPAAAGAPYKKGDA